MARCGSDHRDTRVAPPSFRASLTPMKFITLCESFVINRFLSWKLWIKKTLFSAILMPCRRGPLGLHSDSNDSGWNEYCKHFGFLQILQKDLSHGLRAKAIVVRRK